MRRFCICILTVLGMAGFAAAQGTLYTDAGGSRASGGRQQPAIERRPIQRRRIRANPAGIARELSNPMLSGALTGWARIQEAAWQRVG